MLILIGNSPSSGSTFLADLLDSTPASICGPEFGLYSNKHFYRFTQFKNRPFAGATVCSPYAINGGVNPDILPFYGLDKQLFSKLIQASADCREFQHQLEQYVFSLRGKPTDSVFFEKTPQNIATIDLFLDTFLDGFFIFLVRNPLHVINSMMNRGFSAYTAASTWLVEVAKYWKHKDNPRVLTVKYEELVAQPFETIRLILQRVCNMDIDSNELESQYKRNQYRKMSEPRIATWSHNHYSGQFKKKEKSQISKQAHFTFSLLPKMKITSKLVKLFNLSPLEGHEALDYFSYRNSSMVVDAKVKTGIHRLTHYRHSFNKYLFDLSRHDISVSDLPCYIKPLEVMI